MISLVVFVSLVNAGCCEETTEGFSCQNVEESQCEEDAKFAPTSCSSTSYCKTGTCVHTVTGECKPNTPRINCEEQGGEWKDQDPEEIPICQNGCCLYGTKTAFVNQVECKQIASDHGVNVNFREDINSQGECFALENTQEEGACVIENEYETTCLRTTKKECLDKKDNKGSSSISALFDISSSSASSIKVEFFPGILCTADELNTDCAPTENTRCSEDDDKAYFVDSCGNLANVYDETMFPVENNEANDYWTNIQDPKCDIEGTTSNSCGDCNYRTGTLCATYDKNDQGMPDDPPEYGNKVCRDLACYYDTDGNGNIETNERYEHGESWCAETPGTYPHLQKDELEKGSQAWNQLTSKEGVTQEYNIPGSRYVKLECRNGQVLEQSCKDYRNGICVEQDLAETEQGDGVYTHASCIANGWRNCFNITNKSSCENVNSVHQCKWVEGYRFDFQNVRENSDPLDDSKQGSCVPLFAPGHKFWEEQGNAGQGAIKENILYEVFWMEKEGKEREDLETNEEFAAQRCFSGNCYAIPSYGSGVSQNQWENIWNGKGETIDLNDENHMSHRKGHYIHKSGDPSSPKTGRFFGDRPDGLDNDKKIYEPPIFRNNEQWINSLVQRARSLGDVGYKRSVGDYWGEKSTERIVSILQKLTQDMETDSNMTEEFVMWEAGEYTNENKRSATLNEVSW